MHRQLGSIVPLSLLLLTLLACRWDLKVQHYSLLAPPLKEAFTLAVLADLHDSSYGPGGKRLLAKLEQAQPQAVFLVGDSFDEHRQQEETWQLLAALSEKWPCYFVFGNHDVRVEKPRHLAEKLEALAIRLLSGQGDWLPGAEGALWCYGVDDPELLRLNKSSAAAAEAAWGRQLEEGSQQAAAQEAFSILLSHRPERVPAYQNSAFNLILCGHAHGGQVRIPGLVNGLYAPHQGPFPPYAGGAYNLDDQTLIVSRGLCKNWLPRVFNRPELVIVELLPKEE